MKQKIITLAVLLLTTLTATAQRGRYNPVRETDPEFFKTDKARRIGDQLLLFQRVTGGWPKNIDMARQLTDEERAAISHDKNRRDDSTTDNGATNMQTEYLARLYKATGDKRYAEAFRLAVGYLLSGQYKNGGWPQFWPDPQGYQKHITFNDNAMVNTMRLLRDVAQQNDPFDAKQLTTKTMRRQAQEAFDRGVECILKTQITTDGRLTVWCQQHDRETYAGECRHRQAADGAAHPRRAGEAGRSCRYGLVRPL